MQREQPISPRYELLIDPLDRYMVWDTIDEAPADWVGEPLAGLNWLAALAAVELLNSMASDRDARLCG